MADTNEDLMFDLCCPICLSHYSEFENKPIILSCGHTVCDACFKTLVNTSQKCGECRGDIVKMTTNYSVLRIVNSLSKENIQIEEVAALETKIDSLLKHLDHKMDLYDLRIDSILSETEKISLLVTDLEKSKTELKNATSQLRKDIKTTTTNSLILGKINLLTKKDNMQMKEVAALETRVNSLLKHLEGKNKYYESRISHLISKTRKVSHLQADLEKRKTELKNETRSLLLSRPTSLKELLNKIISTKNLMEEIIKLCSSCNSRLQFDSAEEVFFPIVMDPEQFYIKQKSSKELYSSVSVKNGKIYMCNINSKLKLEMDTKLIEFDDICPYKSGVFLTIKSHKLAFCLEFELENGVLGDQFEQKCIGMKGSSLLGVIFSSPSRLGREGESISFVDGKKPVSTPAERSNSLNDEKIKAGVLVSEPNESIYTIYLEDWPPITVSNIVARLVSGIHFLRTCVRNGYPTVVTESGVVFNLRKICK